MVGWEDGGMVVVMAEITKMRKMVTMVIKILNKTMVVKMRVMVGR